jgi:hypothetical protein
MLRFDQRAGESRFGVLALIAAAGSLGSAPVTLGQCQPEWGNWFASGDLAGQPVALLRVPATATSPAAIYATGFFPSAGQTQLNHVARWDGALWRPLGTGLNLYPPGSGFGIGECLALFDESSAGGSASALFVGGEIVGAGGVPALGLARWDGNAWTPVGAGLNGPGNYAAVYSMAVFDEDGPGPIPAALFVGGSFATAGGQPAVGIARWDGISWSPVGGGVTLAGQPGHVQCVTALDPDGPGPEPEALFVGGKFDQAGAVPASNIARWDGHAWSALGAGVRFDRGFTPSPVTSIVAVDTDGPGPLPVRLCVGGDFNWAGDEPASNAAAWDGASWVPLGTAAELYSWITALVGFDDGTGTALYAAMFANFSSVLLRWSGAAWEPASAPSGSIGNVVTSLTVFDPDGGGPAHDALLVGGSFGVATDPVVTAAGIWDGSSWSRLAGPDFGPDNYVWAISSFDVDHSGHPALVISGIFNRVAGVPAAFVAVTTAQGWQAMGDGFNEPPQGFAVFDEDGPGPGEPHLFAAGRFWASGASPCYGVARWDGAVWTNLGAQGHDFYGIAALDPDGPGPEPESLYVFGRVFDASWNEQKGVFRWTGSQWAMVGEPFAWDVRCLTVFDEDGPGPAIPTLFAGGYAYGGPGGVAKWDGSHWVSIASVPTGNSVNSLAVFDDDGPGPGPARLYVGGQFAAIGGVPAAGLAAWDGSAWTGFDLGPSALVRQLLVYDEDGPGPQRPELLICGRLLAPSGLDGDGLVRFDGTSMSGLGAAEGYALGMHDDGLGWPALYFCGDIQLPDFAISHYLTRYGCPLSAVCYANCDGSNTQPVLNVNDFICFQSAFVEGNAYANCDGSTTPPVLNIADFVCFQSRFAAGCP